MAALGDGSGAAGDGGASLSHSDDGTQLGMAATSSSSETPELRGHSTVLLQLHDRGSCGGSHGPDTLLPAPRERKSCGGVRARVRQQARRAGRR